ncbi:transcriptional Coactivator p15-domain-containing protein [Desarmillaria tabescens]|uniref:Transcriptional Coactivator p15-domain-containing protein n=1 Tax=Armillaria tabescens TaxID=1929756 RepID=A0AA39N8P0_ARMTA|nr:transcriptional Coactivator p15-domain-containing protein [Desarmillaria tabescens]KAK0461086.1 transcriptional Coactivator p15-domain-containing protein [Desarmillaria tabescens]
MAKRKAAESSEDEAFIDDASDASEPKPKRTKAKNIEHFSDEDAPSTAKGKTKSSRSKKTKKAEESSDEDEPIETKSKPKKTPNDSRSDAEVVVHKTSDGDKYIDLGKKKRATVRSFKGMPLLDIREFYGQEGDEKPGKKGISLSLEQWKTLKDGMDTIDRLFATVKK